VVRARALEALTRLAEQLGEHRRLRERPSARVVVLDQRRGKVGGHEEE
jgi:hypothetical protein